MTRYLLGIVAVLTISTFATAGPADLFPEKEKDFGVSPRGMILVHYFRFTNDTKETITLGSPRVSCGCVTPALSKTQVGPGETAAVIAYMDTRRIQHAGVTKTVFINVPVHSPRFEEVVLKVSTVTRDDLLMSPDTISFGSVTKGAGATASTQVTFTSDANWKIEKIKSSGAYVKPEFKLASRNGNVVTYDVTATLDKDCPAGNWTSDLYLETSNAAVAKLRIPVTVNVVSHMEAKPETVSFGEVRMGSETEKQVTIQAKAPFKILDVKGADDALSVKVESEVTQAVHKVTISFNPVNPAEVGGLTRNIEIITDSKEQPKIVVPVTAKVIPK